jgi:hypothetical protein
MMQDQEVSRAARDIEAALRASGEEEALRHWPTMQACATSSLACLRRTYPAPA